MIRFIRLSLWGAAFVLVEVGMFLMYRHHDARFHWFAHFFTGASTALIVMTGIAWRKRRPIKAPLVWIALGHIVAGFPDLLFALFQVIHRQWMNVFLLHISIHFIPGRNVTLYVVLLAALALYLFEIGYLERQSPRERTGGDAPFPTATTGQA